MSQYNQQLIKKHVIEYKKAYRYYHKTRPTCWYSFLKWLCQSTLANSFDHEDMELAKKYFPE
jgi:hypothetical protein